MYVRFPLSLRNVRELLFERGIDVCHETVRHWWNRFGPIFAAEIRQARASSPTEVMPPRSRSVRPPGLPS
jgi:putative transposase